MPPGKTHIEKYNELFTFQVEKLAKLGKIIGDDELVSLYLYSLSEDFVGIAKAMIMDSVDHPLPRTRPEATAHITELYTTETAVNKKFGIDKRKGNKPGEVANPAVTPKNLGRKGKGKGEHKGNDKNQTKPAADNTKEKDSASDKKASATPTKQCEYCKAKNREHDNHFKRI